MKDGNWCNGNSASKAASLGEMVMSKPKYLTNESGSTTLTYGPVYKVPKDIFDGEVINLFN